MSNEIPAGVMKAGGILDRIVEAKAARLKRLPARMPDAEAGGVASRRDRVFNALGRPGRVNIIAEIKRRSPSKGVIRSDFHPAHIAGSYHANGAAMLSVLTEEDFFGGSLEDLRAVRQTVDLPLLRKDFIFDERQIAEAAGAGADAVLLIVAILEDELLRHLLACAESQGLAALVEVHTELEMERALGAGARLIGVNNRDLTTFQVGLGTSERLARLATAGVTLVSESGIATGEDIRRLRQSGYHAFLIGEHFMRAADPGAALRELIEGAGETHESSAGENLRHSNA